MATDFKTELGQRLRAAREQTGISVKAMAQSLEVAANTVYAYENGQNQAPMDVVVAYARITGTPLGRLGGFEPEPEDQLFFHEVGETPPPLQDLSQLSDGYLSALIVKAGIEVHKRLRRPH